MNITINLGTPLSDDDRDLLRLLAGGAAPAAAAEKAPSAPEKAAPAPRKASAKKPAKVAEPEPEDVEEDVEEDAPAAADVTREDVVARATELVSSGKAAQVKAALKSVGAGRVSDVEDDDLATLMDALS